MRVSPKLAAIGVLGAIAVAGALVLLTRGAAGGRAPLPQEQYVCGNPACAHQWTQELTNEPICPRCGAAGAKEARYTCARCGHTFTAWHTRRVGVGRSELLLPGAREWTMQPPDRLTCPKCGLVGRLGEAAFPPAGFAAPAAGPGI